MYYIVKHKMPYKYKSRKGKSKVKTVRQLNRKVMSMMSTLKPELKVSTSNMLGQNIQSPVGGTSNYGIMVIPNPNLLPGTSYDNERIGQKIRLRSIQIKGTIRCDPSTPVASTVRFLLVRYPKTGPLPLTSLLSNTTQPNAVNSMLTTTYREQFQVLYDKCVVLNPYGNEERHVNIFKKCNFPVDYIFSGSTVTNGEIYLFIFSNFDGSNAPKCDLVSRVRYTDL